MSDISSQEEEAKSRSLSLRAVEALEKGEVADSLRAALEAVELSLQDPTSRIVLSRVLYELGLYALAAREVGEVMPLLKDKRVAEQLMSQLTGSNRITTQNTKAEANDRHLFYAESEISVEALEELSKENK